MSAPTNDPTTPTQNPTSSFPETAYADALVVSIDSNFWLLDSSKGVRGLGADFRLVGWMDLTLEKIQKGGVHLQIRRRST